MLEAAPGWYSGAAVSLALFAGVLLVGRPAGLGLAFLGIAVIAAAARVAVPREGASPRDLFAAALWVLAAALAAVPAVRAAEWVWVPCVVGGFLLGSLAATGGRSGRQVAAGLLSGLRRLPLGPLAALAPAGRGAGALDAARLRPALRGGLLAAVLLAVFVPLFAAADAAFAEILDRTVPDQLDVDLPVGRVFAAVLVLAAAGSLAIAARVGAARAGGPARGRLDRIEWALPLGALIALFAAFVALQLATLFGGHDHVLRTAGLTYAEYARQGFGQLIAAAGLTLAVIAGARRWARAEGARDERLLRVLLAALCVLCLVILASALKRLGLYEQAFGFTRLRLLAHTHILWLGAVLVLVLAALAAPRASWLPRALVLVSAAGALAFAASNPDGRIAARNVDRYMATRDLDAYYLSQLSPDAAEPLSRLRAPAPCAVYRIRARLRRPDGLLGANLGRSRARRALAALPPGRDCR